MSASVLNVQIANSDARKRISAIIWAETHDLSREYEISLTDMQNNNAYELLIKSPDGNKVARNLQDSLGDLCPAVFRHRLRELLKLL